MLTVRKVGGIIEKLKEMIEEYLGQSRTKKEQQKGRERGIIKR